MRARSRWLAPAVAIVWTLASGGVEAADYYARTAGAGTVTTNWNQNTTWTADADCNGAALGVGVFPGPADNVFICSGKTVNITANAQAASVTFLQNTPAGGTNSSLVHGGGVSLAVGGAVTINGSNNANGTRLWNIGTGSATVGGNVTLNGGSNNSRIARINLSSGTLTIAGDLVYNAGNVARAVINTTAAPASARINLAGQFTVNSGTLAMGTGTAIFNYNGAVAQTVRRASSIVYRHLHLNNTHAAGATLSAAVSATTVTGDVRVQSGIFSNGGFAIVGGAGDTFEVADGARFNLAGTTSAMPTGFSTITLGITPGNMSTVAFQGSGNQTIATGTLTYGHLIAAGSSEKRPAAGTLNVAGDLTVETGSTFNANTSDPVINVAGNVAISGTYLSSNNAGRPLTVGGNFTVGGTYTGNNSPLTVAGDFTRTGTFNSGTGAVTFNGASVVTPQTLTGATTFTNMTVNNTGLGISLANNITVTTGAAGTLALTNGEVTTNANVLIVTRACNNAASVTRTNGYVVGNFQKAVPNGSTTCLFQLGAGGNYSPATLAFIAVGGAGGGLIGRVGLPVGDHPNLGSSGLDPAKSVNRWWGFTRTGVTGTALPAFTSYGATLQFVAGDVDMGANTANFEVERWNGAAWNITTAGTRTGTTTQATGITALGELAVGEKKPVITLPGRFNAYDGAPAGKDGVIKTKVAGSNISLAIVAVNSAGTGVEAGFSGDVQVEIVNSSSGGAVDGNNCNPAWPPIDTTPASATVPLANGTGSLGAINAADSYPNARIRVIYPVGSSYAAATAKGCSVDNFAIRPNGFASFAVTDNDWQTAGIGRALTDTAFGAVLHKAGRPFSVRANAVNAAGTPAVTTNYTGAPTATLTACGPGGGFEACTAAFGTLTLDTTFASGQLASDTASYSEVGSFALQLVDSSFASVDAGDGSTPAERDIVSPVINVGRFVPDHFAVALNTPGFTAACGAFTYVGQVFNYATPPVITITARNFANQPTTFYADTTKWWRITNSTLTGKTYTALPNTLDTSGAPGTDPVITDSGSGTGTLAFGSGTGFFFTRTAPSNPFNAEIALAINVIDADGVAASNPVQFGAATAGNGIAFSGGKGVRFGRLRVASANGSQLVPLSMLMETQYWNGSSFITNAADSCTSVAAANVGLGNYTGNLAAGETVPAIAGGSFANGRKILTLSAPGKGNNGSAQVVLNLGASTTIDTCAAWSPPTPTPGGASLAYLRGQWCGATHTKDPTARATFGAPPGSGEVIHSRELLP